MTPHIPIIPGDGFARNAEISLQAFIEYIAFTALWEEMAFRVVPIKVATIINPKLLWPVIFLSSIIFGWGHGGLHGLMFQGVMGIGFSYVYVKSKYSYLSVVVLHAMWNTFCYLML
jgi:membrane protease YdiL (CAAX protease family)